MDIARIIEYGYVNHIQIEQGWQLQYKEFWVKMVNINERTIDSLYENPRIKSFLAETAYKNYNQLRFGAKILCEQFICSYIIRNYDTEIFEKLVTMKLNMYFIDGNSAVVNDLEFSVVSMGEDAIELYPSKPEKTDYVFYISLGITSTIVIIAMFAWLYNKGKFPKLPGFNVVDDARWLSVIIFALQFWDFGSDVNLCVEIWTRNDLGNILLLISAVGSTLFVLIPYIANLIMAANIKNIIRNNEAAKAYFQHNTPLFCLLVVLTGGTYPALSLVSSNVFGLKIVSSGLTQYELGKLSKIKIFGTVVLENVPQLIFQALYAYTIDDITDAVGIAFFASILSVTASTLSYLIDRDNDETKAVEYYLAIQCQRELKQQTDDDKLKTNIFTSDTEQGEKMKSKSVVSDICINDNITDEEKLNIINNRGRTEALSESLAALCEIQPKSIEIGSTFITKQGAVTHVIHFVYKSELEMMQSELSNNNNLFGENISITPNFYTKQLYGSLKNEVTQIFRNHFELNDDFKVIYYDLIGRKRRRMAMNPGDDDGNNLSSPNNKILQKIVTHTKLNLNIMGNGNERELKSVIHKYFNNNDNVFNVKRETVLKIMDNIENDKYNKVAIEESFDLSLTGKDNEDNEFKLNINEGGTERIYDGHSNSIEMISMTNKDDKNDEILQNGLDLDDNIQFIQFQQSVKL
eukprot:34793_1